MVSGAGVVTSPYSTPPEEANTNRPQPARAAASSTLIRPRQLTWASNSGSRTERLTDICAAWWQTASGRSVANTRCTAGPSTMSTTCNDTPDGRLSRTPLERSSITATP